MVATTFSVAFEGVEARLVEVQCSVTNGLPAFTIVGLGDRAVSEAKERIRSAFSSLCIAMPSKRVTVNLSPADIPKEGSHFDLPIALALLGAMEVLPHDVLEQSVALGELSLEGGLVHVSGALPAAVAASEGGRQLFCPETCGAEAAWVEDTQVIAGRNLLDLVSHLQGRSILEPASPGEVKGRQSSRDIREVRGQERAKRALEIAAAGRHHLLMCGPPGAGKSMLAARLPGLLPPLSPREALETSMIHSLAGLVSDGGISRMRPFRAPHHTASMAAIVGGGRNAKPGEISLAHNGVLFLDELPEFATSVLETLRQPIETGDVMVARANAHVRYPCKFMLIAAANPCRCGHLNDPEHTCGRAPRCGQDYMGRISGPLLDRFDLRIDIPAVQISDLELPVSGETSEEIATRVAEARHRQSRRYDDCDGVSTNADLEGEAIARHVSPDGAAREMLKQASERTRLSARGYHRILRVARTIADLAACDTVKEDHVAEALSYRGAF